MYSVLSIVDLNSGETSTPLPSHMILYSICCCRVFAQYHSYRCNFSEAIKDMIWSLEYLRLSTEDNLIDPSHPICMHLLQDLKKYLCGYRNSGRLVMIIYKQLLSWVLCHHIIFIVTVVSSISFNSENGESSSLDE